MATVLVVILVPLYSYFVSDTVVTTITDAQMTMVDGKFMIAYRVPALVNSNAYYRFSSIGDHPDEAIRLKGKRSRSGSTAGGSRSSP